MMNWKVKTASFKYAGTPVVRTTYTYDTPLGQFKAYEAVNGTPRYKHPFRDMSIQNGVKGLPGYQPDPGNEIMPDIGILAKSLEDAKIKCEQIWEKVKGRINEF